MGKRSLALLVLGVCVLPILAAAPATAATVFWSQNQPAQVAYWSSKDFYGKGTLYIGGKACARTKSVQADAWYVELKRTLGEQHLFYSYSYPADGYFYYDHRAAYYNAPGDNYYIRWYGQITSSGDNSYSPCSTVYALH